MQTHSRQVRGKKAALKNGPVGSAVSDLAIASIGAAAAEAAALGKIVVANNGSEFDTLPQIDRRLASLWFGWSIHPDGWQLPAPWDTVAGDYETADGWIKLHTNAPHHRDAALTQLQLPNTPELSRETVAAAVRGWNKDALEQAIVDAGGCAAAMRSAEDWQAHPQGRAVQNEPLMIWRDSPHVATGFWPGLAPTYCELIRPPGRNLGWFRK